MVLTLKNRLIVPYSDKETFKVIFGDTQTFQFKLPTPHVAGDTYALGLDQERVVYPPSRPLCAYSTAFTVENDVLTMTLKYNTNRLRSFVCTLKKPTTIYIQLDRIRDGKADTLLLDTLLAMPSVLDSVNTVCEGDPLAELLGEKMDKPAVEGTAGQILALDENGQCVWRDEQEIPEQVQVDWDESDSTDASYIQNKPDLSVYAEKSELSAVATSGDYDDLSNRPELAAVATSGSYNDLIDKPVIPVQKNADWDESDSTDPSFIQHKPDLSVYSLVTETGNKLSMSIDEDYDLVVRLLDKNDNVLSTQDIDLPLEAMIVNASYASGVLTLTLQNGQTVDVDISDIVSGLVPDSRTINGQSLNSDVTLTAQDLSLAPVATSGDYDDLSNKPDLSLKLDAPSVAGTVGQVLTKTATGQEWADAQGGGVDEDTLEALDDTITMLTSIVGELSDKSYFHVTALEPSVVSFRGGDYNYNDSNTFEYSYDRREWFKALSLPLTVSLDTGEVLWLRNAREAIGWDFVNESILSGTGGVTVGGELLSLASKSVDHTKVFSDGGRRLHNLFSGWKALKGIEPGLNLSINGFDGLFEGAFQYTGLTNIPDNFAFPEGVTDMISLFRECYSLTTVGAGFVVPSTVTDTGALFFNCDSLSTIGDGFTIPSSVTSVSGMLYCPNLTTIGNNVSINPGTDDDGMFVRDKITSIGTGFDYMSSYTTSYSSGQAVFPNATIGNGWKIYQYSDL